jgi:hypothetical protein
VPARNKPDARRSVRYQARISLDDRDGPLWERIEREAERARPKTMLYLMRLGMAAELALTSAAPRQPAHDLAGAEAPLPSAPVGESAHQLSRIQDFNLDAFSI